MFFDHPWYWFKCLREVIICTISFCLYISLPLFVCPALLGSQTQNGFSGEVFSLILELEIFTGNVMISTLFLFCILALPPWANLFLCCTTCYTAWCTFSSHSLSSKQRSWAVYCLVIHNLMGLSDVDLTSQCNVLHAGLDILF